jgi:hypothetical protein
LDAPGAVAQGSTSGRIYAAVAAPLVNARRTPFVITLTDLDLMIGHHRDKFAANLEEVHLSQLGDGVIKAGVKTIS